MFERFTERARQVVVLAQEEARTLKHNYIGTEHILLGLLREEEVLAARVLESLGITVERVRAQVVRIVGSGEEVTSGVIPFTPRGKKVLELAVREALSLGHNDMGTEHSCLAWCARTRVSPGASCSISTRSPTRSATRSSGCCLRLGCRTRVRWGRLLGEDVPDRVEFRWRSGVRDYAVATIAAWSV
jgi:ATP-dependent Clp protease ATP-binding subunit ClpA